MPRFTTIRFLEEQLFNGEYFQQKVQYLGLHNTSFASMVAQVGEHSSEMQRLLKHEGPKYQYGNGCLSDGVIGAWMARMYGIDTPLAREKVQKTLQAIFKHNFKTDLSLHANAQRPGYAMGHEPGLLLCALGLWVANPPCLWFTPTKSGPESNTK
jgi:Glycosyl-hydrolase family 116, catalytic region